MRARTHTHVRTLTDFVDFTVRAHAHVRAFTDFVNFTVCAHTPRVLVSVLQTRLDFLTSTPDTYIGGTLLSVSYCLRRAGKPNLSETTPESRTFLK